MGVMSICIKDMAGIMGPQEAYDLVKAIKAEVKKPPVPDVKSPKVSPSLGWRILTIKSVRARGV